MTVSRSHRNPPNARLTTNHAGVNSCSFWFSAHPTTAGARSGGTLRYTESLAKPSSGAKRIREVYSNPYSISYFSYSWAKGDPWTRVWGTGKSFAAGEVGAGDGSGGTGIGEG